MSDSRPPLRPLSGASLGLELDAGDAARADLEDLGPDPFGLAAADRYTDGGLLGEGGMGQIRAVTDGRLGRVVALKVPNSREPQAQQRFTAEATLTARLEHPAIIAIYDAGRLPDGRPYYTMPVVRGRSLADAMEGQPLDARLRLMRHFLDACEAVAYAHSEGLLHRDLKPGNILVGRFGETAVVDWGLAGAIGEPASSSGRACGTPPYMPLEQQRGEALFSPVDVYALGMTLKALLMGGAPDKADPKDIKALPADLWAIAERATQPLPGDRYPDARALADDVAAWFEGRRVAAHRYSWRELVGRAWSAYRTPMLATGLAILGISIAVAGGYWRTALEHRKAVVAARAAEEARDQADRHLAMAEVAQSLEAMAREDRAQAEVLAASALSYAESPEARGVLARFDSPSRPQLLGRLSVPGCEQRAVSRRGTRLACLEGNRLQVHYPDHPEKTIQFRDVPAIQLTLTGEGEGLMVEHLSQGVVQYRPGTSDKPVPLEQAINIVFQGSSAGRWGSWLGGHKERWCDLETGKVEITAHCAGSAHKIPVAARVTGSGVRLVMCQDGTLMRQRQPGRPAEPVVQLEASLGVATSLVASEPDEGIAAVGLALGGVAIIDLISGRYIRTLGREEGAPFDLDVTSSRLAVSDGRDRVSVWELSSGQLVSRLPARGGQPRWLDGGQRLRVVGRQLEDWALPERAPWPHVQGSGSGVASVAISPDGLRLASAHGDGSVLLRWLDRTGPVTRVPLHWSVAKDVDFSPDGRTVAAICAQDPRLFLIDVENPSAGRTLPAIPGRRLAFLRSGTLLLAPYGGGLWGWQRLDGVGPDFRIPGKRFLDMEADVGGDAVTLRDISFAVFRHTDGAEPRLNPLLTSTSSIAVAGSARGLAILERAGLSFRSWSGETRRVKLEGAQATEVAASRDGRYLAVGQLDGTVSVYRARDLERLAVLRGHSGRVSTLKFDLEGRWLVSGSWDGDVRLWSMRSLEVPASVLVKAARGAWGRGVDEVLDHGLVGVE